MLPWRQYQSILTLYIHKLQENIEYQKQLVRIVIEVLNAFHFDLTLADMACLEKRVVKSKSDNDFKLDQEKIDPKHDEIESVVPKTTSTLTEEGKHSFLNKIFIFYGTFNCGNAVVCTETGKQR